MSTVSSPRSWTRVARPASSGSSRRPGPSSTPPNKPSKSRPSGAGWGIQLRHGPSGRYAGTSWLEITGDTPTLTRFHDRDTAIAHDLLDPDHPDQPRRPGPAQDRGGRSDRRPRPRRHPATQRGRGSPKLYLHLDADHLLDPTAGIGHAERLGPVTTGLIKHWLDQSRVTILRCYASTAPTRSTSTTHPHGCASWSPCATGPASTPTANATPATATSTTSAPTSTRRRRTTRPNTPRQPRPPLPETPPSQDPRRLGIPPQPRRHLHLAHTPRPHTDRLARRDRPRALKVPTGSRTQLVRRLAAQRRRRRDEVPVTPPRVTCPLRRLCSIMRRQCEVP